MDPGPTAGLVVAIELSQLQKRLLITWGASFFTLIWVDKRFHAQIML